MVQEETNVYIFKLSLNIKSLPLFQSLTNQVAMLIDRVSQQE